MKKLLVSVLISALFACVGTVSAGPGLVTANLHLPLPYWNYTAAAYPGSIVIDPSDGELVQSQYNGSTWVWMALAIGGDAGSGEDFVVNGVNSTNVAVESTGEMLFVADGGPFEAFVSANGSGVFVTDLSGVGTTFFEDGGPFEVVMRSGVQAIACASTGTCTFAGIVSTSATNMGNVVADGGGVLAPGTSGVTHCTCTDANLQCQDAGTCGVGCSADGGGGLYVVGHNLDEIGYICLN